MIQFAKIEATGNDFICVGRKADEPFEPTPALIRRMCDRHFGIGADGFILMTPGEGGIPLMRYFNADGLESTMCGNGLRAAVLFAHVVVDTCKPPSRIRAADGVHRVQYFSSEHIRVEIFVSGKREPVDAGKLELPAHFSVLGKVDTGVPHLVIDVGEELDTLDVPEIGKRLRNHLMFKPEGSNINFLKSLSDRHLEVRTYERGVEDETLSCGTGVTASALLFRQKHNSSVTDMEIVTKGGRLNVRFEQESIFLEGPAHPVFMGYYSAETGQTT